MTEAEWNACTDPQPMLEFLRGKVSERKLRLFAVACCRRIDNLLPDKRCRLAVGVAERFADGKAGTESLRRGEHAGEFYIDLDDQVAGERVTAFAAGVIFQLCLPPLNFAPETVASGAITAAICAELDVEGNATGPGAVSQKESTAQQGFLRCIFGPLRFRRIDVSPSWQTATVASLAEAIYQDRAFDRLPILADALEDAGCTDPDILAHCRGPGPHVRGCWVVDLLLAKN